MQYIGRQKIKGQILGPSSLYNHVTRKERGWRREREGDISRERKKEWQRERDRQINSPPDN